MLLPSFHYAFHFIFFFILIETAMNNAALIYVCFGILLCNATPHSMKKNTTFSTMKPYDGHRMELK